MARREPIFPAESWRPSDAESALVPRQPAPYRPGHFGLEPRGRATNGLELLQDLYAFNPDVVAILGTGYAAEATPRWKRCAMGVRDYLDKNQDLNRGTFLQAVRRQLDRIRPAKRTRQLHQSLVAFREVVEKNSAAGAIPRPPSTTPCPYPMRSVRWSAS